MEKSRQEIILETFIKCTRHKECEQCGPIHCQWRNGSFLRIPENLCVDVVNILEGRLGNIEQIAQAQENGAMVFEKTTETDDTGKKIEYWRLVLR